MACVYTHVYVCTLWMCMYVCVCICSAYIHMYLRVFIYVCMGVCVCVCVCAQSHPTLCSSMDYSLPASSVHLIPQASVLEWVAISSFRRSPQPRDWTCVSCIGRRILYHWATWEAHGCMYLCVNKSVLWVYLCVHMYTHIYIPYMCFVYICLCMHVYVCVCVCVCVYDCLCTSEAG